MTQLEEMKVEGGRMLILKGVMASTDFIRWFFSHQEKIRGSWQVLLLWVLVVAYVCKSTCCLVWSMTFGSVKEYNYS